MARRKKIQSGGYEIGRLVEQSGGMVDEIVHPTLLADNEAHLLKNVSLDEKGTIKTCKGREERFGSAFDANNPTSGIGVFYKSDGTTRLVMAAGTKLYSDTPHVTTKYDSQADWDSGTKSTEVDTSTTPGDLLVATGSASNKTQTITSQADWETGTLSGVDATASPGDIVLDDAYPRYSETDTLTADFNGAHTDTQASNDSVILGGAITTIDHTTPTTVVNSAYDTSGNGGRKLVRLNNGTLVAIAYDNTNKYLRMYSSADDGQAWIERWSVSNAYSNGKISITSLKDLNRVAIVYTTSSGVYCVIKDAYGNGYASSWIDSGQNDVGATSITKDFNGHLHVAWSSKNSSYPNCFNIRYAKSTDNGANWSNPQQVTTLQSTNYTFINPQVIICSDGQPALIFQGSYSTTSFTIHFTKSVDGVFPSDNYGRGINIYADNTYSQSSPSATVDNTGIIHVVWEGYDSTDTTQKNLRYAKSVDGGTTWSVEKITTGNDTSKANANITTNKNNDIFILFQGHPTSSRTTWCIMSIKNISGVWSSVENLTPDATEYNYIYRPSVCDNYKDFQEPLAIWQDNQNSRVAFHGKWSTSTYSASGWYTHTVQDISTVIQARNSSITFNKTTPTNTTLSVQVRLSTDGGGTWGSWTTKNSGDSLVPTATDLTNYRLQWRVLLDTTDDQVTPSLDDITITIESIYAASGTWTGVSFDVTDINPNTSTITWAKTVPVGTSVTVETRGSDDNINWGAWTAQTSGQPITTLNLYNQARVILATTDQTKTPTVSSITMTVTQDGKRAIWTSPTIDVSTASDKSTGHISTSSTLNTGSLQIQSRSSADNGSTWTTWVNASVDGTLNHAVNNHIQVRLIYTKDASIQDTTISFDGTPSASELATGFTAGGDYYFATLLDYMCIFNGLDIPKKYDGATVADIGGSPPRCTYVVAHKNRLFTAKASSNPSRLYFSDLIDIDTWGALSFIDISPNDGDHITGLLPYDDYLVITKQRSVWVLVGSTTDDFEVRRIHDGIGCVAPRSLVKMDEVFAFVSSEGIYASDLSKPILLTERIKETWRDLNRRKLNIACAEFFDHKLRVDVPNTTSTSNNLRIIFDAIRKSLYLEEFTDHASCYAKFTEAGQEELLYGHSTEGQVSKADAGTTDAGTAITMTWETKWFNFGSSATEKKARYLYFVVVPANSDVTINVYLIKDGVEQEVPLIKTIIGSNNSEEDTIKLNPREIDVRKFRSLGYKITQSTTNGGVKFHELLQEYLVKKVKAT